MEQSLIKFRIQRIITEAPDTRSFILETETGEVASYAAGQYLTFIFFKPNGEQERRNYSISSSPVLGEPMQVTVKRVPNGAYSRWLVDDAKAGDTLLATGVSGFFTLPEGPVTYSRLVFFAAGSGITPIFSLIKTVLHTDTNTHIVLVYSNTSEAFTIFYDALIKLQEAFPERLHIEFLFSVSVTHQMRRLNVELVEQVVKDYFSASDPSTLFYLCGPIDYMRMISIILRTEGVRDSAIRREIFHVEKLLITPQPPDTLPHSITVTLGKEEHTYQAKYPATILQAAKALQIPLPYSCEAGQCGTCAATCVSGKVWMWRNDVLMDEEIAKGRILTCTGYAVDGDVVLQY